MLRRYCAVLLGAALILPVGQRARAHTCPTDIGSGAGMGLFVTALRGDGVTPIGSAIVAECETILFQMAVVYLERDPITLLRQAAFEGGEMILTVNGITFDITPPGGVPLLGGDGGLGCSGTLFVASQRLPYVVTAADVAAGTISVLGVYTNGTAHIGESDLPRVVHGSQGYLARVGLSVACSTTPTSLIAREGDTASFCSTATNGTAPYQFNWTGPGGFSSTNQCISITNVGGLNAGVYQALITDAFGCTNVCEAILTVIPSLRIAIADGKLDLSWSQPATGFVLQQADDLYGSWFEADDQTNPQNILATTAARFYRLAK